MIEWQRTGHGYDILYLGFVHGKLVAKVYRGGGKWYPWSWYLEGFETESKHLNHGMSETLRAAKDSAQARYTQIMKKLNEQSVPTAYN